METSRFFSPTRLPICFSHARPLIILLALALSAFLLLGCASPAPNGGNTTGPSGVNASGVNATNDTGAQLIALQAQIEDLRAQMQDAEARLSRATSLEDAPNIHVQMQALKIISANLSSLLSASCNLQAQDCSADLAPLRQLSSCADTYAKYEEADQLYLGADQSMRDCRISCSHNDAPSACLIACNPNLQSLQDACVALQPLLSSVKNACVQTLSDSFYSNLASTDAACESTARLLPYLPPAQPVNNTPIPPAPDMGPKISGEAVIDPLNGSFKTNFCRIEAKPSIIQAGKETLIEIYAYAGSGEDITYTCGDLNAPRSAGYGGLLGPTSRICSYYSAGPTTVWVALNGYVCASAPLDVDSTEVVSNKPACQIAANTQTMNRSGTSATYSAAVRLRHQSAKTGVRWGCDAETFNATLGQYWGGDDINGVLRVSCTFNDWTPSNAPGRVMVGGQDCGSLSTEN